MKAERRRYFHNSVGEYESSHYSGSVQDEPQRERKSRIPVYISYVTHLCQKPRDFHVRPKIRESKLHQPVSKLMKEETQQCSFRFTFCHLFSPEFVAPIEFLMLTCLFAKNNFSGQVKPFRKQRSKLGKCTRLPCFLAMNEKLTPMGRSVLLSLLRAIFMDLVIVKHNSSVSPMTHACSSTR